ELYRQALQHALTEQALQALKTFPLNEAAGLATRLFIETGPVVIKILRGTGRVVGAPIKGLQHLGRYISKLNNPSEKKAAVTDREGALTRDLMLSANTLRNRLMDDHLIILVTRKDNLYSATESLRLHPPGQAPVIEPAGPGMINLHIPVPQAIQNREQALLEQNWEAITTELRQTAHQLMGLPTDIEDELRALVVAFRTQMTWQDRLRETFFASLSALPPLLGITYTLLTANPVSGAGIWINLQSVFGINDLWALVSIPASAGLSSQERKQLELTINPVFQVWLQHRLSSVKSIFERTICDPIIPILDKIPLPQDPRFERISQALLTLGEPYGH
ncbi:MAG: CBS domain-containing protein, partial [Anaerolineae bacterium]